VADPTVQPQHTPGPWSREKGQRFRHDESRGIRAANGIYIAAALDLNNYGRDAEVDANARLIAAAPGLLDALGRALYGTIEQAYCGYCGHLDEAWVRPMPHTDTCWVPAALEAIAASQIPEGSTV